ncbi:MAG: hypothetical protein ACT4P1_05460 [Sporichthyaceae bacterium]
MAAGIQPVIDAYTRLVAEASMGPVTDREIRLAGVDASGLASVRLFLQRRLGALESDGLPAAPDMSGVLSSGNSVTSIRFESPERVIVEVGIGAQNAEGNASFGDEHRITLAKTSKGWKIVRDEVSYADSVPPRFIGN